MARSAQRPSGESAEPRPAEEAVLRRLRATGTLAAAITGALVAMAIAAAATVWGHGPGPLALALGVAAAALVCGLLAWTALTRGPLVRLLTGSRR